MTKMGKFDTSHAIIHEEVNFAVVDIDGLVQEKRNASALAMGYVFLALTYRYYGTNSGTNSS